MIYHAILTIKDQLPDLNCYFCLPMKMLSPLVLMFGGNLAGTDQVIERAVKVLSENLGEVVSESGLYISEPWGMSDQPPFLNKAMVLLTGYEPEAILDLCLKTEQELGRKPGMMNGPRLIDIDIMFLGDRIIETDNLTIPHPRMHLRNFNLIPLNEIIPDFIHPVCRQSILELTQNSPDTLEVRLHKTKT